MAHKVMTKVNTIIMRWSLILSLSSIAVSEASFDLSKAKIWAQRASLLSEAKFIAIERSEIPSEAIV
jgi:hypothetical protein